MAKKKVVKKNDDSVLFAFLATFLSIVGFVIALIVKRDNKYVMYYAKQSLVIFIIGVIAGIVANVLGWLFVIGSLIKVGLNVLIILIWVFSWVNALSGKKKEIPIVSYWSKRIDL